MVKGALTVIFAFSSTSKRVSKWDLLTCFTPIFKVAFKISFALLSNWIIEYLKFKIEGLFFISTKEEKKLYFKNVLHEHKENPRFATKVIVWYNFLNIDLITFFILFFNIGKGKNSLATCSKGFRFSAAKNSSLLGSTASSEEYIAGLPCAASTIENSFHSIFSFIKLNNSNPLSELIITNDVPLSWSIVWSIFSIPQKSANVISAFWGNPLNLHL